MKEKELRLALVCYGGVSLAVYMHGVTKEILKLVRASRIYHGESSYARRQTASFAELEKNPSGERDTESIYFDLLQIIGETSELRVLVDTIAGASAGGINGVLLARAIAHDLSLDSHRKMWLEEADILALMDDEHLAGKWSKLFMKPIFWVLNNRLLTRFAPDAEMRQKLLLFTRSRWFKPPFSGRIMSNLLLNAFRAMNSDDAPTNGKNKSLLPIGHKLELIVSVTDFYGYTQDIPLHDPVSIREREHRHVLKFRYVQHTGGRAISDFDDAHIPGLAFAARATSSFPGAFPPTQIGEIDQCLVARRESWPTRAEFIASNFKPLLAAGSDPAKASFIDGSVLNNKPFGEAIASLRGRPAYREVDRRIVYIDPDPEGGHLEAGGAAPGFFHTIRGALSDIPRNQPVRDELESIHKFSERVRQYQQIVSATRPHVATRVREILGLDPDSVPTKETLSAWRNRANTQAAVEAGYAYDGYIQLKVSSVLDRLTQFIAETSGVVHNPAKLLSLSRAVEAWAKCQDIFPVHWTQVDGVSGAPTAQTSWVKFLRDFDLNFRIRRMRFVVRRLNELYDDKVGAENTNALDEFKASAYESLELLTARATNRLETHDIKKMCVRIFDDGIAEPQEIEELVQMMGPALDLIGADRIVDESFAIMAQTYLPPDARAHLLQAYVGFPFFDVLTLPLNKWDDLDDVDTMRVDRISPEDAKAIRQGGALATLMGRNLGHFAAFFSRRARENDYLWGRLHAADRLVDIVASAGLSGHAAEQLKFDEIKGRLFRAVIEAEKPFLTSVPDLIKDLEHEISKKFGNVSDEEQLTEAAAAD
ncbi:MAG: patatin-like protein [Parvibaculum sp.]|nr:patatin-like protein [Parvibaculum sp.]